MGSTSNKAVPSCFKHSMGDGYQRGGGLGGTDESGKRTGEPEERERDVGDRRTRPQIISEKGEASHKKKAEFQGSCSTHRSAPSTEREREMVGKTDKNGVKVQHRARHLLVAEGAKRESGETGGGGGKIGK